MINDYYYIYIGTATTITTTELLNTSISFVSSTTRLKEYSP